MMPDRLMFTAGVLGVLGVGVLTIGAGWRNVQIGERRTASAQDFLSRAVRVRGVVQDVVSRVEWYRAGRPTVYLRLDYPTVEYPAPDGSPLRAEVEVGLPSRAVRKGAQVDVLVDPWCLTRIRLIVPYAIWPQWLEWFVVWGRPMVVLGTAILVGAAAVAIGGLALTLR